MNKENIKVVTYGSAVSATEGKDGLMVNNDTNEYDGLANMVVSEGEMSHSADVLCESSLNDALSKHNGRLIDSCVVKAKPKNANIYDYIDDIHK